MNHLATYDRIAHSDVATEIGFNEEVVRLTLQLKETETLQAPENQGIFEKFVNKTQLLTKSNLFRVARRVPCYVAI